MKQIYPQQMIRKVNFPFCVAYIGSNIEKFALIRFFYIFKLKIPVKAKK